jgi:hypothetical protein
MRNGLLRWKNLCCLLGGVVEVVVAAAVVVVVEVLVLAAEEELVVAAVVGLAVVVGKIRNLMMVVCLWMGDDTCVVYAQSPLLSYDIVGNHT